MLAHVHASQMAFQMEAWPDVIAALDKFLSQFPESPHHADALYERGWANYNTQNYAAAIQDFQNSLRSSRGEINARARFMLGRLYALQQKRDDAIKNFRLVMYGFGGERASQPIKDLQAQSGFEAGKIIEAQSSKTTGNVKAQHISEARIYFRYVIQKHSSHNLAAKAKQRLQALFSTSGGKPSDNGDPRKKKA